MWIIKTRILVEIYQRARKNSSKKINRDIPKISKKSKQSCKTFKTSCDFTLRCRFNEIDSTPGTYCRMNLIPFYGTYIKEKR